MQPADRFIKDVLDLAKKTSKSSINPDDTEEIILNNNVATELVPLTETWVHFISIRAIKPGRGHGTQALKQILALADRNKVNLIGKIIPYDTKSLSVQKLQAWYKQFKCRPLNPQKVEDLWVRITNPQKQFELLQLSKKDFKKIHNGMSNYDFSFAANKRMITAILIIAVVLYSHSNQIFV